MPRKALQEVTVQKEAQGLDQPKQEPEEGRLSLPGDAYDQQLEDELKDLDE